jgi:hypothetical protein
MAEKKEGKDFELKVSYVLGLTSLILSISLFSPLAGLVSSIIGFNLSKRDSSEWGIRAKKVNKWGIFISAIIIVVLIVFMVWATVQGLKTGNLGGFPQY